MKYGFTNTGGPFLVNQALLVGSLIEDVKVNGITTLHGTETELRQLAAISVNCKQRHFLIVVNGEEIVEAGELVLALCHTRVNPSTYTTNRSIQIIREIDRNFRKIEAAAYVVEARQRDIHWHLNGRTTWRIDWLAGVRTSSSKGLSLVQHCLVQHSDVSLA